MDDLRVSASKRVNLADARWWRFSAYELRDGFIRPVRGAELQVYFPWQQYEAAREQARGQKQAKTRMRATENEAPAPHLSLIGLLQALHWDEGADGLGRRLTPESETLILQWCSAFGLLGSIVNRVHQIHIAPRKGSTVLGRPRIDRQIQVRTNSGWSSLTDVEYHVDVALSASVSDGEVVPKRHVAHQPYSGILIQRRLNDAGDHMIAWEELSKTWAHYFPDVPAGARRTFQYPLPLTEVASPNMV